MKLSELIDAIWKDERIKELRLRKDEVDTIVKVIVEIMGVNLLRYGKLKMQGLFTLEVRKIKGRKITNPQTQEYMYSKDYHKIGIIPSKKMKQGLKDLDKK